MRTRAPPTNRARRPAHPKANHFTTRGSVAARISDNVWKSLHLTTALSYVLHAFHHSYCIELRHAMAARPADTLNRRHAADAARLHGDFVLTVLFRSEDFSTARFCNTKRQDHEPPQPDPLATRGVVRTRVSTTSVEQLQTLPSVKNLSPGLQPSLRQRS